jgi:hypothetical protein
MRWFEWGSEESFDAWHNAKIEELNLPQASINQASGEIDETAQRTISYTTPHFVENKIIAMVEDEHSQGLTETMLRLPEPPNVEINS